MTKLWDGEELTDFPSSARERLRPMSEFDPTRPALVNDEMNDQLDGSLLPRRKVFPFRTIG